MMLTLDIEFSVEYDACGSPLEARVGEDYKENPVVVVAPCEDCLDNRYNEGLEEGGTE